MQNLLVRFPAGPRLHLNSSWCSRWKMWGMIMIWQHKRGKINDMWWDYKGWWSITFHLNLSHQLTTLFLQYLMNTSLRLAKFFQIMTYPNYRTTKPHLSWIKLVLIDFKCYSHTFPICGAGCSALTILAPPVKSGTIQCVWTLNSVQTINMTVSQQYTDA